MPVFVLAPGVADLAALLCEVEAHRADQRPGPEGEHEADEAVRPVACQAEQRADDQRRRRHHAPEDRLAHTWILAGAADGTARRAAHHPAG